MGSEEAEARQPVDEPFLDDQVGCARVVDEARDVALAVARGWGEVRDGRGLGSPRAILTLSLTLTLNLSLTLTSLARGVDDLVLVEGHEVHVVEAAQLLLALLPAGRVDDLAHVLDYKVALMGLG